MSIFGAKLAITKSVRTQVVNDTIGTDLDLYALEERCYCVTFDKMIVKFKATCKTHTPSRHHTIQPLSSKYTK